MDETELAHEVALILADDLAALGRSLPLAVADGQQLRATAALIGEVLAPAMANAADAAEIAGRIADAAVAAGTAMLQIENGSRDAAPLFYAAATDSSLAVLPTLSPAKSRALSLARAIAAAAEASYLGEAFLMEATSKFADRQAASDARQRIADAMDAAGDRIAQNVGGAVYDTLAETAYQAMEYLVSIGAELRPVVRVEATLSLPSTALAWSLYGDPRRAQEMVLRNRCGTPLFMPPSFEALSPDA